MGDRIEFTVLLRNIHHVLKGIDFGTWSLLMDDTVVTENIRENVRVRGGTSFQKTSMKTLKHVFSPCLQT